MNFYRLTEQPHGPLANKWANGIADRAGYRGSGEQRLSPSPWRADGAATRLPFHSTASPGARGVTASPWLARATGPRSRAPPRSRAARARRAPWRCGRSPAQCSLKRRTAASIASLMTCRASDLPDTLTTDLLTAESPSRVPRKRLSHFSPNNIPHSGLLPPTLHRHAKTPYNQDAIMQPHFY